MLPVKYYHMVFTIPDDLYGVAFLNQKIVYDILFRSVSETLLQLGRDPKHLGASIGFTAILHTWGQNLMFHPHIHCVLPGGGLSLDEKSWTESRNDFFIPVKLSSRLFRGKFLFYLTHVSTFNI